MNKLIAGALVVAALITVGACANSADSPVPTPVTTTSGYTPAAPVAESYVYTPPVPLAPAAPITDREWALIAKDPAAHIGQRVVVFAQVTQFDAATGANTFRGNVGAQKHAASYGWVSDYKTNTVLTGDPTVVADVVEGDLIRVEATVDGALSYSTQIGGSTTVPQLTVTGLKVNGHV